MAGIGRACSWTGVGGCWLGSCRLSGVENCGLDSCRLSGASLEMRSVLRGTRGREGVYGDGAMGVYDGGAMGVLGGRLKVLRTRVAALALMRFRTSSLSLS